MRTLAVNFVSDFFMYWQRKAFSRFCIICSYMTISVITLCFVWRRYCVLKLLVLHWRLLSDLLFFVLIIQICYLVTKDKYYFNNYDTVTFLILSYIDIWQHKRSLFSPSVQSAMVDWFGLLQSYVFLGNCCCCCVRVVYLLAHSDITVTVDWA